MDMNRRYKLFGFGVLLGCVIVYFSLIKNSNNQIVTGGWLPEGRVLNQFQTVPITMTPEVSNKIICNNLQDFDVLNFIKNNASVNFSQSKIRDEKHPVYLLESKNNEGAIKSLWIESNLKNAVIKDITMEFQNADCE